MMQPTGRKIVSAALAGAGFMVLGVAALPAQADGSMVIRDFMLSHGIDQREPISNTESFRMEDGKAFAFARIHNTGGPTMVNFVWYYGDKAHATVPVTIGQSPGWRVWTTTKLRPGQWRVELADTRGDVLAEKSFNVGPGSPAPIVMQPAGLPGGMPGGMRDPADPIGDAMQSEIPASAVYPAR